MRSEDGHSYDRASIEHWFRSCREEGRSITSPKTNARLPGTNLIPNITLRGAIDAYNEAVAKLRETLHLDLCFYFAFESNQSLDHPASSSTFLEH